MNKTVKTVLKYFLFTLAAIVIPLILMAQTTGVSPLQVHELTIGELGVIFVLVLQTGAFFYWGGKLRSTLDAHETRICKIEEKGSPTALITSNEMDRIEDEVKELHLKVDNHVAAVGVLNVEVQNLKARVDGHIFNHPKTP
jgi:hypothetical protein